MPDRRHHRGPHPDDAQLFAPDMLPTLRTATADLGWLLDRGYASNAALKLVGDRFQLQRRQRMAVQRAACAPSVARTRRAASHPVADQPVVIDGFNVLITVEAMLSGGVLLRGTDGRLRDLASVHGNYRRVDETRAAITLLSTQLRDAPEVRWLLDRPVSNSGRVAAMLRDEGWEVDLIDAVDATARDTGWAVATADGPLLDQIHASVDLTAPIAMAHTGAWIVDLQTEG